MMSGDLMVIKTNSSSKLGYPDYAAIPNDGLRHEIIEGDHYVNPAPDLYHQAVSKRLQHQLYVRVELAGLGVLYHAPCDVQLSEHDIVQPDLLVVVSSRTRIFTPTKVKGAPDLLVEILSESTADHDRTLKRGLYERSGVREYWMVDPCEHTLEQLMLQDGKYQSRIVGDKLCPEFIDGVLISLEDVW
ncbi:MAG: Uma2 family endonuclease [Planctomycetes bacterium]|nr:Uma2 family endonuclease [Planctomycetota bacterium]